MINRVGEEPQKAKSFTVASVHSGRCPQKHSNQWPTKDPHEVVRGWYWCPGWLEKIPFERRQQRQEHPKGGVSTQKKDEETDCTAVAYRGAK